MIRPIAFTTGHAAVTAPANTGLYNHAGRATFRIALLLITTSNLGKPPQGTIRGQEFPQTLLLLLGN